MNYSDNIIHLRENENTIECLVQLKPCKRTILMAEDVVVSLDKINILQKLITFPFYQIFYLTIDKNKNILRTTNRSNNRMFASDQPLTDAKGTVYPINYPHITPNGKICQNMYRIFFYGIDDYVNTYMEEFWSSINYTNINDDFSFVRNLNNKFTMNDLITYNKNIKLNIGGVFELPETLSVST